MLRRRRRPFSPPFLLVTMIKGRQHLWNTIKISLLVEISCVKRDKQNEPLVDNETRQGQRQKQKQQQQQQREGQPAISGEEKKRESGISELVLLAGKLALFSPGGDKQQQQYYRHHPFWDLVLFSIQTCAADRRLELFYQLSVRKPSLTPKISARGYGTEPGADLDFSPYKHTLNSYCFLFFSSLGTMA